MKIIIFIFVSILISGCLQEKINFYSPDLDKDNDMDNDPHFIVNLIKVNQFHFHSIIEIKINIFLIDLQTIVKEKLINDNKSKSNRLINFKKFYVQTSKTILFLI